MRLRYMRPAAGGFARRIISPHTAKTHINRAMAKLGARDRAQLVVIAYQTGLASLP